MTVSDSNPIQFWLPTELSFNEKTVCGLYNDCFCQIFNSNDTITIQVNSSDTTQPITLKIWDSNDTFVSSKRFDQNTGYYQVSFSPSDYSLSGKYYFTIETSYYLYAETGMFTLTGEDIALSSTTRKQMTADVGLFAVTGQDVILTYTQASISIESEIISEAFGAQTFKSVFDNGLTTKTNTITGSGGYVIKSMQYGSSVTVTVTKTTNGGLAQDTGFIDWKRNGTIENTQAFGVGDSINYSYTFTGVSIGDTLKTEASEG